ncbi:MAG: hypothetical protein LBL31_07715, partial [Spirochaetaceae bacterium]|nr:hypothetical protein [Spirochaetaceae bacterium]
CPPGYSGAVAFFKVGGPAPKDHTEMKDTRLLTRSKELFMFAEAQLGETFYITLCWQNGKGHRGPPAPIQSHVIS